MSGSAPLRAAIMISFDSLPKTLPLAFAAASLCFAFHCAPMLVLVSCEGNRREFYSVAVGFVAGTG